MPFNILFSPPSSSPTVAPRKLQPVVEIHKTNQRREAKAFHAALTVAKESATLPCVLKETQRQAEKWESCIVGRKGRLRVCRDGRRLARGSDGGLAGGRVAYVIG